MKKIFLVVGYLVSIFVSFYYGMNYHSTIFTKGVDLTVNYPLNFKGMLLSDTPWMKNAAGFTLGGLAVFFPNIDVPEEVVLVLNGNVFGIKKHDISLYFEGSDEFFLYENMTVSIIIICLIVM